MLELGAPLSSPLQEVLYKYQNEWMKQFKFLDGMLLCINWDSSFIPKCNDITNSNFSTLGFLRVFSCKQKALRTCLFEGSLLPLISALSCKWKYGIIIMIFVSNYGGLEVNISVNIKIIKCFWIAASIYPLYTNYCTPTKFNSVELPLNVNQIG